MTSAAETRPQLDLEAWVSFLRSHAAITRSLSAQLQREHGLTLNDYEVLLHLKHAENSMMRRVDLAEKICPGESNCPQVIDATQAPAGVIATLAQLIREYPGESPVLLDCVTSQGQVRYELGPGFRVKPAPDFYAEVRALLGESALA